MTEIKRLFWEIGITPDIADALKDYIDFKHSGVSDIDAFLAQQDMFANRPSLTASIMREFFAKKASQQQIADTLREYAKLAMLQDNDTPALFETEIAPRERLWELAVNKATGERYSIEAEASSTPSAEEVAEARRQYDEVVARYTNPDGTKKPGWMKAPNGKPTKLTEEQWVWVRTPNFKKWFGDWEALVELVLPQVDVSKVDAIKKIDALLGMPLTNISTGIEAVINTTQRNKIISNAASRKSKDNGFSYGVHNAAASIIDKLWKHASLFESRKDNDGDINIKSIKRFVTPFKFDNTIAFAYITAKESIRDGHRIYSLELQDIKTVEGMLEMLNKQSPASTTLTKDSLYNLFEKVNPSSVSKVVDENGEPLVVYHATDNSFTEFKREKLGAFTEANGGNVDLAKVGFWFNNNDLSKKLFTENSIPVFLNIKNPSTTSFEDMYDGFRDEAADGYIVDDSELGGISYVATSPSQIKSATDNIGTFDPANPDIRYSITMAPPPPNVSYVLPTQNRADEIRIVEDEVAQKAMQGKNGLRPDGTRKGLGFFGALATRYGGIMTEFSVGFTYDGKNVDVPTLNPLLTRDEISYLLRGYIFEDDATWKNILDKTARWGAQRLKEGKSPFIEDGEPRTPIPQNVIPIFQRNDIRWSVTAAEDRAYLDAVRRGDMETAQRMVLEKADMYLNEMLLPDDADEIGFKYHRGPAPTKTFKRYAVFNVKDGGFHAAYAGNKSSTPVGVWLDSQNLESYVSDMVQFDDGTFATYIPGDTGADTKSKFSSQKIESLVIKGGQKWLLERGGKHSSDVPNFSQMNLKVNENGEKVSSAKDGALPHNKLVFEIEYGISDDGDLTEYVSKNGRMMKGKNQGLAKINPNQYYDFKTNPNAVGNWGIGGTFRITRLVPYSEIVSVTEQYKKDAIAEAEKLYSKKEISKKDRDARVKSAESIRVQKWVGGYNPADFGLSEEIVKQMAEKGGKMKLTDPVTYDDNGNVIPLSERFNPQNNDIRFSISGIYTGSAADYEKPSLHYVGTGEGSQVYGWGLYGSNVRGVAEGYAKADLSRKDAQSVLINGKDAKFASAVEIRVARAFERAYGNVKRTLENLRNGYYDAQIKSERGHDPNKKAEAAKDAESWKQAIEDFEANPEKYRLKEGNLYEQTFFTNRAPGDESHLLMWYGNVSDPRNNFAEQKKWIRAQAKKEGVKLPRELGGWGEDIYNTLANVLGSPKAASEFLARAGIDGVKYPVDSYGKTVKDGDKAGWNYVSFRDDNIRVDHKWVDGVQRFSITSNTEAIKKAAAEVAEFADHREDLAHYSRTYTSYELRGASVNALRELQTGRIPLHSAYALFDIPNTKSNAEHMLFVDKVLMNTRYPDSNNDSILRDPVAVKRAYEQYEKAKEKAKKKHEKAKLELLKNSVGKIVRIKVPYSLDYYTNAWIDPYEIEGEVLKASSKSITIKIGRYKRKFNNFELISPQVELKTSNVTPPEFRALSKFEIRWHHMGSKAKAFAFTNIALDDIDDRMIFAIQNFTKQDDVTLNQVLDLISDTTISDEEAKEKIAELFKTTGQVKPVNAEAMVRDIKDIVFDDVSLGANTRWSLTSRAYNPDARVLVVDGRDEPDFQNLSTAEIRNYIKDKYRNVKIEIYSDGTPVLFTTKGLESALKKRGKHKRVLHVLDELVKHSHYTRFEPNDGQEKHSHLDGQLVYTAAIRLKDGVYSVELKLDIPTLSPDNPLFKGQTLKTKIADAVLSVSRANGVELTSDYETSAKETIRLGDIVSSPLIVSDGGNTVNFSFENVINTQAARLKSQQILDDIKGTVLGDAINKDFKETSTANLIGQTITSPEDLAALAQIYRNPSFETFRYFFVKNGEVVWQTGVTARLPSNAPVTVPASGRFVDSETMQEIMRMHDALQPDTVYLLHNHPSGNVQASGPDIKATQVLAKFFVDEGINFGGHIIIDHNVFGLVDAFGNFIERRMSLGSFATYENSRMEHPKLLTAIKSPADVAKFAADLQRLCEASNGNVLTLIGTRMGKVVSIANIPTENFAGDAVEGVLKAFQLETGAADLLIAGDLPINAYPPEIANTLKTAFIGNVIKDFVTIFDTDGLRFETLLNAGLTRLPEANMPNAERVEDGSERYEIEGEASPTEVMGMLEAMQDEGSQTSPTLADVPHSRYQIEAWGNPYSYSKRSLVQAMATADLINGNLQAPERYRELAEKLGVRTKDDIDYVAEAKASFDELEDKVRALQDKGLTAAQVAAETAKLIDRKRFGDIASRIMSQSAKYGVDVGGAAMTVWQKIMKRLAAEAKGLDLAEMQMDTGADLLNTIIDLMPEEFGGEPEKASADYDENGENENGYAEGEFVGPPDLQTWEEWQANEADRLSRYNRVIAIVKASIEEKQKAIRAREARRAALETSRTASAGGDTTVDEHGNTVVDIDEDTASEEPISNLAIPREILESHRIDLNNADQFAAFIRAWVTDWLVRKNSSYNIVNVLNDPTNLAIYRKTIIAQLRNLADGLLDPALGKASIKSA